MMEEHRESLFNIINTCSAKNTNLDFTFQIHKNKIIRLKELWKVKKK